MKKTKKLTWLFKQILFLAVLLLPSLAFADGGGDSPIGSGLSWIVNLMYGSTGVYLATIAIAGMGIACYFHVFEWIRFIQTVIGVSIVFGAGAIVTAIQTLTHSSKKINPMSTDSDYVIEIDDLAVGLTRPPMIFGVSMIVAFAHLMIAALSYIYLRSFIPLPLVGLSFLVCVHLSIKEPRFLDIHFQQFTKHRPF